MRAERFPWMNLGPFECYGDVMARKNHDLRILVGAAAAITIIAWQFPAGRIALWPFTLLATFAHELGHGLTAMLLGADFQYIVLRPDGSGVATWTGSVGRLGRALIAAGGLAGPAIFGALTLVLSRSPRAARPIIGVFAFFAVFSFLRVGSVFTAAFLLTLLAAAFALFRYASVETALFATRVAAVELGLSVFQDMNYMFSPGIAGQASDSAAIADALLLPYWFWGGLIAAFSLTVVALGTWIALGPRK